MPVIAILNEAGLTPAEMKLMLAAVTDFVPKVTQPWGCEAVTITDTATATSWNVHITSANRHTGALGYHDKNSKGIPYAYCLPGTAYNRFGNYHKPLIVKGRTVLPESMRSGTLSVICHEIAEMLGDPLIQTVSMQDKNGHQWLVEIADPVAGVSYMKVINGTPCIFPDVVLPSFYDIEGKPPYSLANNPIAPFTIKSPKGYAYWRNALGKFIKI